MWRRGLKYIMVAGVILFFAATALASPERDMGNRSCTLTVSLIKGPVHVLKEAAVAKVRFERRVAASITGFSVDFLTHALRLVTGDDGDTRSPRRTTVTISSPGR